MLINLSNHPYALWSDKQKTAASVFGKCMDIPFPPISPEANEHDIEQLANLYLQKILSIISQNGEAITVHLMGEMTFSFSLIQKLHRRGICCIASCTKRNAVITNDDVKLAAFDFERFRNYHIE